MICPRKLPRQVDGSKLDLPATFSRNTEGGVMSSCPKTQTNSRLARRAVSIVIDPWRAPDRRRCRRFGFPVRAGKTPSSNRMPRSRAETWIQARAAHGVRRRRWALLPGLDPGR